MKIIKIRDSDRLFLEGDLFTGELGVDIRGLPLNDVTQLRIWIPVPYGTSFELSLPSEPLDGKRKEQNSKCITSSSAYFPMQHELDGESEDNRMWIFVDIPPNLDGVDFLLINTKRINVPGWGSSV